VVRLYRAARTVLSAIREEQSSFAAKNRTAAPDFVFEGLKANTLGLTYRKMLRRAEITGLTFHDLRHEAISRMFELGLSTMEVATISGHQTLQLLKRYAHLQLSDLAKKLG
jgi:integrase